MSKRIYGLANDFIALSDLLNRWKGKITHDYFMHLIYTDQLYGGILRLPLGVYSEKDAFEKNMAVEIEVIGKNERPRIKDRGKELFIPKKLVGYLERNDRVLKHSINSPLLETENNKTDNTHGESSSDKKLINATEVDCQKDNIIIDCTEINGKTCEFIKDFLTNKGYSREVIAYVLTRKTTATKTEIGKCLAGTNIEDKGYRRHVDTLLENAKRFNIVLQ